MAAYTRKQYSGAARNTTTTTLLTNVGTTVDIAATTGWPSIAGIPFYVVISPSSLIEEKCLATISGSTLTLVRAQDDTTASQHPIGSVIYPVFTANDADEANELVSKLTTAGDLLTTDGTNLLRLGVGPNGYFLKASSSASAGIEWASIPTINSLDDIGDVTITSVEDGDFLTYNSSASAWVNETIHFITVSDNPPNDEVAEGDFWYNSLELELYTYYSGSWVQMTDTGDGVQELYELVDVLIEDPVSGEALVYNGTEWINGSVGSASVLENARIISLSGDVSGSVSFDGSQNVVIPTTVQINSITLGVDTTGNFVNDITAGTGVTVVHTPSEGSSPTVSIGQAVSTSSSVAFAHVTSNVTGDLTGNADTATALETARTIQLSGDVSGSASFNGTSNINISTIVNTSSVAITELFGVDITNPEEFQTLEYNGTEWVNQYASVVSYVRNAEATTITTGTPVYLFGGNGDHASVKRADNSTDVTSSKTVGLAGVNIAASQNGPVITRGYVDGVDLSMYNPGDVLWLGKNGQVTTTKPSAPDHLVFIGVVVRATNNGIVYVATQNGYELEELHDVKISGVTDGQFLRYNSASTMWINDTINLGTDTAGDYVQSLVAGTGVTLSNNSGESATPTISIGQAVGTSASVTFAKIDTTGDVTVGGNLTVNGTTTTLNTETLAVEDNIVVLNSNVTSTPTTNAGIEIERGTSDNVSLRWNESSDAWEITSDGTTYENIATETYAATLTATLNDIGDVNITQYSIGDTGPAGGKIFITPDTVGNSTGMYFEAAPTASQLTLTWATGANQSSAVSGADGTGIGTGSQNTVDIVAQSGNISGTSAAVYASEYTYNGFSDWFLPSIDELQELYDNKTSVGGLLSSNYWSSTEYSATQAQYENLGDGGIAFAGKQLALYVRPVRAFFANAGEFLKYNGSSWVNDTINLGTDTAGNYMSDLTQGTGVIITHTPGEGSNATIAIGQAVGTTASVTFANVTADLIGNVTGNASTVTNGLYTSSSINSLADVDTVSASPTNGQFLKWNGTNWVPDSVPTINALDDIGNVSAASPSSGDFLKWNGSAWINDVVDLGTDTSGNYVNDITAGTGVTVTHTPGEGSSPTVAIGQSVATSASVTFSRVETTGDVVVGGNLTVNGTTTTLNTDTLAVEDNIIVLNSNVTSTPTTNAGIEIERGTSDNVLILWNESTDKWEITNDGSTYGTIAQLGSIALGTDTTGNYMSDVSAGTGITVSHTPSEGSTATVSISDSTISTKTNNYTLALVDKRTIVEMNVGSANTVTVPPNNDVAFPTGSEITIFQYGAGKTQILAGSGVTIRSTPGNYLRAQYAVATLVKRGTDEWVLFGDLSAS